MTNVQGEVKVRVIQSFNYSVRFTELLIGTYNI